MSRGTVGIIGAGEVGSQVARGAIRAGYEVVIANSRGPHTLVDLVAELGPAARAESAAGAAVAGDFVVVAAPMQLINTLPEAELAGKVVLDTNNYMAWRDGPVAMFLSGERTEHEVRQEQLPRSKVVKAFTHIQAPRLTLDGRPRGSRARHALSASSDYPEAVEVAREFYDALGFDMVDNSPLSESWRSGPGQPAWIHHAHQSAAQLALHLDQAHKLPSRP